MQKIIFKNAWEILKDSAKEFSNDKAMKLSASLAYYTVFSLAPMLIVIISLSGFFFGEEAMQGEIYNQIKGLVGEKAALQIQEMIRSINLSGNNLLSTIIGVAILLIGATGVFIEIQDSINYIWGIKAKPQRGLLKMIVNRLLSFSMVVSLGFLMMVSLIINAILMAISQKLASFFPDLTVYIVNVFNFALTFCIIVVLFAIIFKVLPDAKIKWKDVRTGAIVTGILFLFGKFGISYYLGHSDVSSAYGAAGSLIIILVWVYYSSTILFFGAEFTKVYARHLGSKIIPVEYAVYVIKEEVEYEKEGKVTP